VEIGGSRCAVGKRAQHRGALEVHLLQQRDCVRAKADGLFRAEPDEHVVVLVLDSESTKFAFEFKSKIFDGLEAGSLPGVEKIT